MRMAIIVPCYNEAKRFPEEYWRRLLFDHPEIRWVFVDDGSTDQTMEAIRSLSAESLSVVTLTKNSGKGNAVRQGWLHTLKMQPVIELIGFLDADGAFPSSEVSRAITLANALSSESDCLILSRVKLSGRNIKRKQIRHLMGRIAASFIGLRWSESPYDTQSGFKIFRNTLYSENAVREPFKTRWFFDLELFMRMRSSKESEIVIWEEPVSGWIDVTGSKMNIYELIRAAFELGFILKKLKTRD